MLILLLENRVEFLKNKYIPMLVAGLTPDDSANPAKKPRKRPYVGDAVSFHSLGQVNDTAFATQYMADIQGVANRIFEMVEQNDPSPNKIYMEWMLQRFLMDDYPIEDVERLRDQFQLHMRMKLHRMLPPNEADILKFPTVRVFLDTMMSKYKQDEHGIISDPAHEKEMEQQSTILLNNSQFSVVTPHTQDAACWFGRATGWCTVWGSKFARAVDQGKGNHYKSYASRGPLYIIHDKANNTRFQFCFEAKQFMDVNDRQINIDAFWNANPDLYYMFLVWRGVGGGVEWKELNRLPLMKMVVGQMPNDEDIGAYRFWPEGKEPPHKTDNAYEDARKLPISHNTFASNPIFGTAAIFVIGEALQIADLESFAIIRRHLYDGNSQAGKRARYEFMSWMNRMGFRGWTPLIKKIMQTEQILFNGDKFGDYDEFREEFCASGDIRWTVVTGMNNVYFCESAAGEVLSRIIYRANWSGGGILEWVVGNYGEDESRYDEGHAEPLLAALKVTLPMILSDVARTIPLTLNMLASELGNILRRAFPAHELAALFNEVGIKGDDLLYGGYKRFDLVNHSGRLVSYDQASTVLTKIDGVTVHRALVDETYVHRLYNNGRRMVSEVLVGPILVEPDYDDPDDGGGVTARVTACWVRNNDDMLRKGSDDPAELKTIGTALLAILRPVLEQYDNVDLSDVFSYGKYMPKNEFIELRDLVNDKDVNGNIQSLANLVAHGFFEEARAMVADYTGLDWRGDKLIVKKFTGFEDLIKDHGDDDARENLDSLSDYEHDHYVSDSDYEYGLPDIIRYMKPEDRDELVACIKRHIDEDEVYDLSDVDDIIKYGREIDEVDSFFQRVLGDMARRAIEDDIYKHYKSALEKSECYYIESGEMKSGMQWDVPYVGTLLQQEVFDVLAARGDPEDTNWADEIADHYGTEPRVNLDVPYNGWSTTLSDEQTKAFALEVGDLMDFQ